MKRNIISKIFLLVLFCISVSFTVVFSSGISWKIELKLSDNIFIDSLILNKSRVYITASEDISDLIISWECSIYWKFVNKEENLYVYDIYIWDSKCNQNSVNVFFTKGNFFLKTRFNIIKNVDIYWEYINYSNDKLQVYIDWANREIERFSIYWLDYNIDTHRDYSNYLINSRKLKEIEYLRTLISDITTKRQDKYLTPVKWTSIATRSSKLPNAGRPYRASYTTWIHEWWDFDTHFWNTVSSIDYWIIVRVIKNYTWSDLWKIKDKWYLSEQDKLINLDILRWNQVWIKTMKWDVAFYAHLDSVFDWIEEWNMVFKWQPLWTVWITWVPDKEYNDYHLHLELRKIPYDDKKSNYTYEDYMSWPWYFKWESEKYILENQYNVFERND